MAHYVYPAAANTAQPAQAYPAVQTAFVAATPQAAAYATAPRAGQAYDAYQTQHTTPQYAYARTQVAVTVSRPTLFTKKKKKKKKKKKGKKKSIFHSRFLRPSFKGTEYTSVRQLSHLFFLQKHF